jgi:hypothetical protein
MSHASPLAFEEHVHGDTVWVAVRARGADWSWLTQDEAVRLARQWLDKYAPTQSQAALSVAAE